MMSSMWFLACRGLVVEDWERGLVCERLVGKGENAGSRMVKSYCEGVESSLKGSRMVC